MSFNKNQKKYNKEVMQTGRQANQYLRESLGLINKYTTDYAGRTDFWTDKLNTRQLDLLSDKYLAQNAAMMRGQSAFGSTSDVARQQEQTAYDQQNYLANVANQNVMQANQLQQNELAALSGASQLYQQPIGTGMTAARNVDAANNSWANILGSGLQAVGTAASFINPVVGGAIGAVGSGLVSATTPVSSVDQQKYLDQRQQGFIKNMMTGSGKEGENTGLAGAWRNLTAKNQQQRT